MSDSEKDEELCPSVLGTKEYWDNHYCQELNGFIEAESTHQQVDVGNECWFDQRIVRAVTRYMSKSVKPSASVIDIGCGNGALLRQLADAGFKDLTGIDYSETAIELSKRSIATKEKWSSSIHNMICDDLCVPLNPHKYCFEIGIDVGTYDAITLRPPDEEDAKAHKNRISCFVQNVSQIVIDRLVMASCNWTKAELIEVWEQYSWQFVEELPTPTFQFGNRVGNSVTCIVFKRNQ